MGYISFYWNLLLKFKFHSHKKESGRRLSLPQYFSPAESNIKSHIPDFRTNFFGVFQFFESVA